MSEFQTSESHEPHQESALPGVNPFTQDVCPGPYGVTEENSVGALNADVLERLSQAVDEQQQSAGRASGQPLVLLTAPRAGYGKTHLLGRMTASGGTHWLILPLAFRMGDEVTRVNVARRGLEALERAETGEEGWSMLREASAGVVATLLRQLIRSGKLPCANPEQALRVLSGPAKEIFSSGGQAHLIGEWLRKHVTQLRKPMAELASRTTGVVTPSEAEIWLQAFIAQGLDGLGAGVAGLRQLATQSEEGCGIVMKLLGLWRPVVVLVDHLDGFYRNAEAGLQIATLLLDLAELDGHPVVLSLNQDVWQATFGHHLPSALEDRLTASRLLLRGLTEEEATELVKLRLNRAGVESALARSFEDFLDVPRYFMGRPLGSVSARVFLRHAAQQWAVYRHSIPHEGMRQGYADEPEAFLDEDTTGHGGVGLLPLVQGGAVGPLDSPFQLSKPEIFDSDTQALVRQVSGGLKEPRAALPQDEAPAVASPGVTESPFQILEGNEDEPEPTGLLDDEEDLSATEEAKAEVSAESMGRVPGSFEKLREMLDRLRQNNGIQNTSNVASATPKAEERGPRLLVDAAKSAPSGESVARAALMGRFEALKLQMSGEAEARPLDGTRVMELIRLAGRRFPLVRPSEHELAGMPDRPVMGWTLRGAEILFAPVGVVDAGFWRGLAVYAAGRAAAARETAESTGEAAPDFKVVVFKSVHENGAWGTLFSGASFPESLKAWIDVVHLDGRSIAALYAMQRIIREAELGTLQAAPQQVMSVLARELDFFWKRITRPLAVKQGAE